MRGSDWGFRNMCGVFLTRWPGLTCPCLGAVLAQVDSRRHDHWICSSHGTEVATVVEAHERVRGRSATVADFERLAAVVQSAAFSRTCAVIHGTLALGFTSTGVGPVGSCLPFPG